jgi:dipeptidyl aminopeptidase/acylaminoacyl peptidase
VEPVSSPSPEPTVVATSECGEVINTTEPSGQAAETLAVVSSAAGMSLYRAPQDELAVLDEATSPFGLLPRFRTPRQVSFVRQREPSDEGHLWGQDSLYEFDIESGEAIELVRLPNHVMGYDWSPDGTRLAFQLRAEEGPETLIVHLCVFDSRTGATSLVQVLEPPDGTGTGQREETMTTWSPNGAWILTIDTAEEPTMAIVDADGYEKVEARSGTFGRWLADDEIFYQERPHTDRVADWTRLSLETGRTITFGLPARSYRPALSPDGRWIAFDNGDSDSPSIFLLDLEQGTTRQLIRGHVAPVWLSSGRIAASAAGPCTGGTCPIPWSTSGTTTGIDIATGKQSELVLPTTLLDSPRNGVIDVWIGSEAP